MRSTLIAATVAVFTQFVTVAPASAEVRYLPEAPGFIEITGADYDLWRAGNLRPDDSHRPHGACVTIPQGGCHCPDSAASGDVGTGKRVVLMARRVARCPEAPSLASGTFELVQRGSAVWKAKFSINRSGDSFSGSSDWDCCPGKRKDPIIGGQIKGAEIRFTRDCRGQGIQGPCTQVFTGKVTGRNRAEGTWTHNNQPGGSWEFQ